MGRDQRNEKEKAIAVLELLRKQTPLTINQEKFCSSACLERFLKVRGDNVKKAAKHLKACLSWRESIGTENLVADEFAAQLAEGIAYVAGHDDESRPVVIFRFRQDHQKFHSQKLFTRLLVFTLEVAIGTMPRGVEQFVLLFDASFFKSVSPFMNLLLGQLKVIGDNYPGRLHMAFVIDPPALFSYIWKGIGSFVELSSAIKVVSSVDYRKQSIDFNDFTASPRASSLRFLPASTAQSTAKIAPSSSSRFAFTVSHRFDSLKPWYLTSSAAITSPSPLPSPCGAFDGMNSRAAYGRDSRTPRHPSFFQSPAILFGKGGRAREEFAPLVELFRRPYDEMMYRARMRPSMGGVSIVRRPRNSQRHVSTTKPFCSFQTHSSR